MEKLITILLAFVVCAISILSCFTDIPCVKGNISNIILAISSIMLTAIVVTKSNIEKEHKVLSGKVDDFIKHLEENLELNKDKILRGLEGVEFVRFNDPNEQIEYIVNRLEKAKISVSDFTWAQKVSSTFDAPVRQKLEKKYVSAIKAASKKLATEKYLYFHTKVE